MSMFFPALLKLLLVQAVITTGANVLSIQIGIYCALQINLNSVSIHIAVARISVICKLSYIYIPLAEQ